MTIAPPIATGGAGESCFSRSSRSSRFFSRASRGELDVRTTWPPEAMRTLRGVETAVIRLARAVIFAALLLAAVAVYITQGGGVVSYLLFALATVAFLATLVRR